MVNVIAQGKIKDPFVRFICKRCGCVFRADANDYVRKPDYRNGQYYVCKCPCCGIDVTASE